ncbi:MAG TPA: carbohydrate ABC transporter permease [Candidatus Scatosoma pullicola]|nr:carbohydrate ABC transporter permease [Candidatus Scatosoma pullicola]
MTRTKMKIKSVRSDIVFDVIKWIALILCVIFVVFPILNVISLSIVDGVYNTQVVFFPVWEGLTLQQFEWVLTNANFLAALKNSILYTVVATIGSNVLMAMTAYPLSKEDCPFKGPVMIFFIITMLFSAGIVPTFVWLRTLNLYNNIWCLILLSLNNVFNMLLYKTNFEGIPSEIEEAAMIDGASSLTLFYRIVIPMTLPVIASCVFFMIVSTWNSYGSAILFISDTDQMPLAQFLYRLVTATEQSQDNYLVLNSENINAATIIISVIPILCVYPFIMNYMKSGLTIGSVKG